jgi:hypothetical protein
MVTELQKVEASVIATLAVVSRGGTVYLKVPKDINEATLGFEDGDNVQIAVMRITHKGTKKHDKAMSED